jgi:hypothetical protein
MQMTITAISLRALLQAEMPVPEKAYAPILIAGVGMIEIIHIFWG